MIPAEEGGRATQSSQPQGLGEEPQQSIELPSQGVPSANVQQTADTSLQEVYHSGHESPASQPGAEGSSQQAPTGEQGEEQNLRDPQDAPRVSPPSPREPSVEEVPSDSEDEPEGAVGAQRRLRKPLPTVQPAVHKPTRLRRLSQRLASLVLRRKQTPEATQDKPGEDLATTAREEQAIRDAQEYASTVPSSVVAREAVTHAPQLPENGDDAQKKKKKASLRKGKDSGKAPALTRAEESRNKSAQQRVPTPEPIRRSRKLASDRAVDLMDVTEINPYFQQQLGKGITQAGPRYLDSNDLTVYLSERAEYTEKARACEAEYRAAGYPAEGIEEVLKAYALIPQESTWVPDKPALEEFKCEDRQCKHHTMYAQLRCPWFNPGDRVKGVMKFCERWDLGTDDLERWLTVPPSLFDLFHSRRFNSMSKPRKRQALLSQSVMDEKNYGLRSCFMKRELKRCTGYIDGELTEDQFKWSWDLAERWRMRRFAPELYIKERTKYLQSLRDPRKARRHVKSAPAQSRSDIEISNLDNSDDSSEDESESLSDHRSDSTEVRGYPFVAMAITNTEEHVYVKLIHGASNFKGVLDPGSSITLLNGIRFIPTKFVGYQPTSEHELRVQNVSGQLISLMGHCDVLMAAGPKVARVQVWFSRELPVDALIGLNTVRALSITMFPIDEQELGEAALKTSEGLRPLDSIAISSMQLCALVREHHAIACLEKPTAVARRHYSFVDPFDYQCRDFEMEIPALLHGHLLSGYYVPAGLRVTFRDVRLPNTASPVCGGALVAPPASQIGPTDMYNLIDKLCTNTNVTESQQAKLKALCHKYDDIFNDGSRPLAMTNLAKFKIELSKV